MKKIILLITLSISLFSCDVKTQKIDYSQISLDIQNDVHAIETNDYIYSHVVGNVYRGVNKCNGIVRPAKLVNNQFIIL